MKGKLRMEAEEELKAAEELKAEEEGMKARMPG